MKATMSMRRWASMGAGLVLGIGSLTGTAGRANAQALDPMYAVPSYTTDDPIGQDSQGNPTLGLATPDGRFQITPVSGCDWLTSGQNVSVYPNAVLPPWLQVSVPDGEPDCLVRVNGRMSATPCFSGASGQCDVAAD